MKRTIVFTCIVDDFVATVSIDLVNDILKSIELQTRIFGVEAEFDDDGNVNINVYVPGRFGIWLPGLDQSFGNEVLDAVSSFFKVTKCYEEFELKW